MKSRFNLLALGLFAITPSASPAQEAAPMYPRSEYRWDNPEFRDRVTALYATHATVEPPIDREDSLFLRETVLPLLESDPQSAIREVENYLETKDAPALFLVLGNLYLEADLLFEAESAFQRAIAHHNAFRRAWRGLAITRFRQDRPRDAIEPWLRVITLGGGDDQSYGLLGYAYLNTDQAYAAREAFRNARLYAPNAADLIRGELEALRRLERPAEALALLPTLQATDPANPDLWLIAANLYLQIEDIRRAAAALETAHALGGATSESLQRLGDCLLEMDLPRPALRAYTAAANTDVPDVPGANRMTILRQLADRGHLAEARELYRTLEQDPDWTNGLSDADRAHLHRIRARFVFKLDGNPAAARSDARTATELDPRNREALILAGAIEATLNNRTAARLFYERATRAEGNPYNAWLALGQLELDANNPAAALKAWENAAIHLPSPALDRAIQRLRALAPQADTE